MDNPYLNRGESIILTTHRISVDSLPYNVMLTTERLILLDDQYSSFRPRSIMLQNIVSLQSGKIPSGEPVIILFITSDEKETQTMHLVFSQQYGEQRKQDRDEWVKKIMELRVALIQKAIPREITSAIREPGLQPSVRHWIAPEKIRPFTNIGSLQPEPVPLTILPDEPDLSAVSPSEEALFTKPDELLDSDVREQSAIQTIIPELADEYPAEQPSSNEIPGTTEEPVLPDLVSEQSESPVSSTAPPEPYTKAIEWPVIEKIAPELADEYPAEQPSSNEIPGTTEEPVLMDLVSEQSESPVSSTPPSEPYAKAIEWPVIKKIAPESAYAGEIPEAAGEPVSSNFPQAEKDPESTRHSFAIALESLVHPPQGSDKLSDDISTMPAVEENPVEPSEIPTLTFPSKQQFQAHLPSQGLEKSDAYSMSEIATQFPNSEELSPQQLPDTPEPVIPDSEGKNVNRVIPPSGFSTMHSGHSGKKMTFIIGCVIFCILLFAGGAMIYSSFSHKATASLSSPAINTTTNVTVKMTLTTFLIPQTGLWVRVNSSGNYLGQAGNPDLLKRVSGTGNQLYKIQDNNGIVQVSVRKQDNSGSPLSVEIYKDGNLIASRTITAPMGSIDFLIDSKTGYPPGLTANGTIPS
jgi:hypothetical protein